MEPLPHYLFHGPGGFRQIPPPARLNFFLAFFLSHFHSVTSEQSLFLCPYYRKRSRITQFSSDALSLVYFICITPSRALTSVISRKRSIPLRSARWHCPALWEEANPIIGLESRY